MFRCKRLLEMFELDVLVTDLRVPGSIESWRTSEVGLNCPKSETFYALMERVKFYVEVPTNIRGARKTHQIKIFKHDCSDKITAKQKRLDMKWGLRVFNYLLVVS